MSTTMEAIYEDGKLMLPKPLPLPEKAHVRVTIETENDEMSDHERAAWLKLSEQSLMKAWAVADDDVFNELLKK